MSDEINNEERGEEETPSLRQEENGGVRSIQHLSGMFEKWFLDYASYVILERAVPYVNDGLKPVQRRILHSMREMDDGRYNKVANIIGNTMKYHPHGDASIGDALVQLGQKNLLVDCQGNWGNIFTGDDAAAPRYIEARLSKFALEVAFNPKTTQWKLSYDGRNREPVTLPVKFPLLLAQGVEGIAVGLASKILPHNFNELLDACVAYLRHEDFLLYPDFPTGGMIDISKYNDGLRGGVVKIRARIEKEAAQVGWPAMHETLAKVDPQTASRLHLTDSQRISRALEVYYQTGKPISYYQNQKNTGSKHSFLTLGLMPQNRAQLHERIEKRFLMMVQSGFLDEVKRLMQTPGFDRNLSAMRAVGYRQAIDYLMGEIDYDRFILAGVAATRQLAKRQLTWMRSMSDLVAMDPFEEDVFSRSKALIETFLNA